MSQRICIVTGGGHGIGRACALRQAQAGDHVAVWDIDGTSAQTVAGEITATGGGAEALRLDVADTDAARLAVDELKARHGGLDGLVHAAGVVRMVRFGDLDEAEYDRLMSVNQRGAFFISQAAAGAMQQSGGGAIVLLSSIAAIKPRPLSPHYAAAKAALVSFTSSCAHAYGPAVRVNAVRPGVIETDMVRQITRERRELLALDDDGAPASVIDGLALKRLGDPDDVAKVIEFLLGPLAAYVTGQAINVDGGMA